MIVYSAGLRVSVVVKLKPEDIDQDRMLIFSKTQKEGKTDKQYYRPKHMLLYNYIKMVYLQYFAYPSKIG